MFEGLRLDVSGTHPLRRRAAGRTGRGVRSGGPEEPADRHRPGQPRPALHRRGRPVAEGGRAFVAGCSAKSAPNPTDRDVAAGKAAFLAGGHDGVIALGGGSGMDAGKAISLVARNNHGLWDFDFDAAPPAIAASALAPLICVPSTAGTGAETESTAMVTDTERGIKGCVWHPLQKPLAAILDPGHHRRPAGQPHGMDRLRCPGACHRGLLRARCGTRCATASRWRRSSSSASGCRGRSSTPHDIEARGAMLVGSCLAGVSFLKGLGLVHAISHMVGARYDTHHGLTNAVLLPVVLRYNATAIADKIPALNCGHGGSPAATSTTSTRR